MVQGYCEKPQILLIIIKRKKCSLLNFYYHARRDGLNKYMAGVKILDILLKLSYLLIIEKMKTGLQALL